MSQCCPFLVQISATMLATKTYALCRELCIHCRTVVISVQKLGPWKIDSCSLTISSFNFTAMTVIPIEVSKGVASLRFCIFRLQMLSPLSIPWAAKVGMPLHKLCFPMRQRRHEVPICSGLCCSIFYRCWFLQFLEAGSSISQTPLLC